MNFFSPLEFTENYTALGAKKAKAPLKRLLPLGILAGMFIAAGGVITNTAAQGFVGNESMIRILVGLFFPLGLIMVVCTEAELFTGNCLIVIPVLEKKATLLRMARNLTIVYLANFIGALIVAVSCVYFGQLDTSAGGLALYTIKIAAAKSALPFANAFIMGIYCNILVCAGVMMALCGKDLSGRILGAFAPVCVFALAGFEHCVANMYYIPAGLFALTVPKYAALAASAGLNTAHLTWGRFLVNNLIPVTLGNTVGGVLFGVVIWWGAKTKKQSEAAA